MQTRRTDPSELVRGTDGDARNCGDGFRACSKGLGFRV